jgi:transposase-like protein
MIKCPKCEQWGVETKWRPKEGLDSKLRQFRCSVCKYTWYQQIKEDTYEREVKDAANI